LAHLEAKSAHEAFEERSAILEFDAGYSREEAERLAAEMQHQPAAPSVLAPADEAAIRRWCRSIGERDEAFIEAALEQCRADPKARAGYLRQAAEVPPPSPTVTSPSSCGRCQHFQRWDHPNLGTCQVGGMPGADRLWDTHVRWCNKFEVNYV
jgi:hypothetical protein